jgi:hypothetical protein
MIAGKAAGVFDDLTIVADEHAVPQGDPLNPVAENHTTYQESVDQYIAWQARLASAFRE